MTPGYNADFDGDGVALFPVRSPRAVAEVTRVRDPRLALFSKMFGNCEPNAFVSAGMLSTVSSTTLGKLYSKRQMKCTKIKR